MTPIEELIARLKFFSKEDSFGCWIYQNKIDTQGSIAFVFKGKRGSIGMHLRHALERTWSKKFPLGYWAIRTCINPLCVNPQHRKFLPRTEAAHLRERVTKECRAAGVIGPRKAAKGRAAIGLPDGPPPSDP